MKLVLCGITRSGTTLFCRYVNALPRAVCFSEPHAELDVFGRVGTAFTLLTQKGGLGRVETMPLRPGALLPLDPFLTALEGDFDLVGFKETFRAYMAYPDEPSTSDRLLRRYAKRPGYRFVFIVRHPVSTWNSVKAMGWDVLGNLGRFLLNWKLFYAFMREVLPKGGRPVVYEKFVKDMSGEFSKKTGIAAPPLVDLPVLPIQYGDEGGATRPVSGPRNAPFLVSPEEDSLIKRAGLVDLYEEACQ